MIHSNNAGSEPNNNPNQRGSESGNQRNQKKTVNNGLAPGQTDTRSQINHYEINLPKGGGAIRGIEEKFQANAVTGTGGYSIPLPLSPGRSGFTPSLALGYDSGSGNSPFGMGWNVDIPAISRKTNRELPQYEDAFESDTFVLSGAEDLVPLLENDGLGNWDRKIKRNVSEDGEIYDIYFYRPRIEGLFARIEKWVNTTTDEVHWRSVTKENNTSIYGQSPEARICDPLDSTRVFKWFLEKTFDTKGNITKYIYKPEDYVQVNKEEINESQRYNGLAPCTNTYLKRVLYSPLSPGSDEFHFQLVFDYGDHEKDIIPSPYDDEHRDWPVRSDPFSSYRSGFDIRTYRLCKRVLMFHNFPFKTDGWQLVNSLELSHESDAIFTYLTKITQLGYKRDGLSGPYSSNFLPPVEFTYSKPVIQEEIQKLDDYSLRNLPVGIDNQNFQWIDAKGEGISGIAIKQDDAVFYKANLGDGEFGPLETLAQIPELQASDTQIAISDIDGDGYNELTLRQQGIHGFFRFKTDHWEQFTPFAKNPTIDWNDPYIRMLDLNGDGRADILITENNLFRWYPSDGEKGYDESLIVPIDSDERKGPAILFNDHWQTIYLADMSGDGLTDIVRIVNGEVCYWPNLGYGKFGAKIIMDNSPVFDPGAREKQQYIKLGDIDGSGTTDIFYFANNKVQFWFNENGNRFSDPQSLPWFPNVDSLSSLSLVDLTGNGTLALVWSSHIPGKQEEQMSYIDLMGEKPHLLKQINNNMGKITNLTYASSSKFYNDDKKQGKKWITNLHFPVHVIKEIEVRDEISNSRVTTEYRYHHGYFDPKEQEFRGFGMVETLDIKEFDLDSVEGEEIGVEYVKPVLTKTWFHTGAFADMHTISKQYKDEYFQGDTLALQDDNFLLPDSNLELSEDYGPQELVEAHRALKSSILRTEIYELGKEDAPYQVTESNYTVRLLQPAEGKNKYGVFFVTPSESINFHYELNPIEATANPSLATAIDPRISHQMTLEVDDYGNILKSCNLVYPRRSAKATPEQQKLYITLQDIKVVNSPIKYPSEDFYLIGIPSEIKSYEINIGKDNVPIIINGVHRVKKEEILDLIINPALGNEIPFEQSFDETQLESHLIDWNKTFFWNEAQDDYLPNGEFTKHLLLHHVSNAVFTDAIMGNAGIPPEVISDGKYTQQDGYYWNEGLIQHYKTESDNAFFLPYKTEDQFKDTPSSEGNTVEVTYDDFNLVPIRVTDAIGNTSSAVIDYRTLQPVKMIDPNMNCSEVLTDELGMVIATSLYETTDGTTRIRGDQPLSSYTIRTNPTIQDVIDRNAYYLQDATSFFYYDLKAFAREEPVQFIQLTRETHVGEPTTNGLKYQIALGYSDGFGREIQSKILVEDGEAWLKTGETYTEIITGTGPYTGVRRWLASGRTVYNNKETPIKQYEPFYTASHEYEPEEFFASYGVTPIIHYDPLLRVIQTDTPRYVVNSSTSQTELLPNAFFSKVAFTPWETRQFDQNDLILESVYYQKYQNGEITLTPEEQAAINETEKHYNTPEVAHLDTLGRR